MKKLFVLIISILVSLPVMAETGFFYNEDRNGEGIIVTIDKDDRLAFAFFTYTDKTLTIPPTVSPPPPDPAYLTSSCAANRQIWYIGTGLYLDRIAIGDLYMSIPIDYPNVAGESLDEKIKIGEFLMAGNKDKDGFDLTVNCNNLVPNSMYLCNETYSFDTLIIGD